MAVDLAQLNPAQLREQRERAGTRIKLVFFDVDGTLVNSRREIPASAIEAIRSIQSQGIKTAFASGRPSFACDHLFEQTGISDAGMFCTGSLLYAPKSRQVLQSKALEAGAVRELVAMARRYSLHLELYSASNYFIEHNTGYTDYHTSYLKTAPVVAAPEDVIAQQSVLKALVVAGSAAEKAAVEKLKSVFQRLRFYTGHGPDRPDIDFISILDNAACKAQAFASLCAYHGVEANEVMAIGDAQSDIAFIELAGTGVAMGNASSAVKAVADYTTSHVDENGLALALETLV